MKITFKCIEHKHIVTVDGTPYTFDTLRDAWTFIYAIRNGVF